MNIYNIHFHDKIIKAHSIFVFMNYQKNSVGTQKPIRISYGKRAIGVRDIEALLYMGVVILTIS